MPNYDHEGAVFNWRTARSLYLGGRDSTFGDAPNGCLELSGALAGNGLQFTAPLAAASVVSRAQGNVTADLGGDDVPGAISLTVERRALVGASGRPGVLDILRQANDGTLVPPLRTTRSGVHIASTRRVFRVQADFDTLAEDDSYSQRVTIDFAVDAIPQSVIDGNAPTVTITGVIHREGDLLIERLAAS